MVSDSGVWISRIAIEGLGPLDQREFELKRFNLFYGLNETGKTYLVEFLIRSLFRHAPDWPLRAKKGAGKIFVAGLSQESLTFSVEHEEKLEDYWLERDAGLPMNMSRLLVVRGGRLELSGQGGGGGSRQALKQILSGEEVIDELLEKIQATVREAELIEGRIVGANRGDLKERDSLRAELDQIDRLQGEIQERLSGARIAQIKQQKARLEAEIAGLERAKQHQAYLLEGELQDLDDRLQQLSAEDLEVVAQALHDREQLAADKKRLDQKIQVTREQSENYDWLAQAVEIWQGWQLDDHTEQPGWQLILAAAAILLGGLLAAVGPLGGLAGGQLLASMGVALLLILAGLGVLLWLVVGLRRQRDAGARTSEKETLVGEYEQRFGDLPAGLADFKRRMEAEREAHSLLEHLEDELIELEDKIVASEARAQKGFRAIEADVLDEAEWQARLEELRADRQRLTKDKREAELALERLGVPGEQRRSTPAEVKFDPDRLADLQSELEAAEAKLAAAQQDLEGLKGEVTRYTDDSVTDPWEQVLANLWDMRVEVEKDYRQLTSRIVAHMAVTQVLTELRAQEDEKIEAGLADPAVSQALEQITGRYHSISLQGSQLVVASDTADYQLDDLSTGARQQVLLAIRLGLARRLTAGEPLFLVLDDAFQHSDWHRRERLVETVLEAARQGWQVTYLTMDNHLRDSIQTRASEEFGDEFRYFEL